MKQMIDNHFDQYGKENYEEIRSCDDSQGNEILEEGHPCPVTI